VVSLQQPEAQPLVVLEGESLAEAPEDLSGGFRHATTVDAAAVTFWASARPHRNGAAPPAAIERAIDEFLPRRLL
jgi:hypothetical protein